MHVPVAAAAAGAAATGKWLFDYNRANFQYDAPLRFARFMTSRNMLNAQVGMYREDVRGICMMTQTKMESLMMMTTLILCACASLSNAGRIGMHGSSPPEWFTGLYSGHIYTTILLMGTSLWLSMHASLRAQCAMVSLLTRKVRLPIPSMDEIDKARSFGSAFEQQRFGDIFRVPFMKHPEAAPQAPYESSDEDDQGGKKPFKDSGKKKKKSGVTDPRTEFGSTTRDTVPSWIRDEQAVDKGSASLQIASSEDPEAHETPEHFKMIAKAQEEWWQYDVYARILMLYGVIHYLFAVTYYCIGTATAELRGFWISWSLPMLFMVAQALILRLDIIRGSGNHLLPHGEWFGHIAPYFVVCATTLEYRITYSRLGFVLSWIFVFMAYFSHIVFSVRLLDLAWPDWARRFDFADLPSQAWWPASWRIPSAFGKHLWLLAPPKKLAPGQHDLVHEMEGLVQASGGVATRRRKPIPGNGKLGNRKRKVTAADLKAQVDKLQKLFQWWFDDLVWSQVPEDGQRRLTELWTQYENARRQVAQIDGEGKLPGEKDPDFKGGKVEDLDRLSEMLDTISLGMWDVEAENRENVSADGTPSNPYDGAYTTISPFKEFNAQRLPDLPWQLARIAILTIALMWVYMSICLFIQMFVGQDRFMKEPGEPPWIRDQKHRFWYDGMWHKSDEPLPASYHLFSAAVASYDEESSEVPIPNEDEIAMGPESLIAAGVTPSPEIDNGPEGEADGHERRLRSNGVVDDLLKALPKLEWLADQLKQKEEYAALYEEFDETPETFVAPSFMAPLPKTLNVAWPPAFEPQHLLRRGNRLLALSARGFGALSAELTEVDEVQTTPFALAGVGSYRSLIGAAWDSDGLHLIAKSGDLLFCPGTGPSMGRWSCSPSKVLPRFALDRDVALAAAAVSGASEDGSRVAALLFQDSPGVVSLFREGSSSEAWKPIGEFHIPSVRAGDQVGLSFVGRELLSILGRTGEVHRRNVDDGMTVVHSPPNSANHRDFRSACFADAKADKLIRLARLQTAESSDWMHLLAE